MRYTRPREDICDLQNYYSLFFAKKQVVIFTILPETCPSFQCAPWFHEQSERKPYVHLRKKSVFFQFLQQFFGRHI